MALIAGAPLRRKRRAVTSVEAQVEQGPEVIGTDSEKRLREWWGTEEARKHVSEKQAQGSQYNRVVQKKPRKQKQVRWSRIQHGIYARNSQTGMKYLVRVRIDLGSARSAYLGIYSDLSKAERVRDAAIAERTPSE